MKSGVKRAENLTTLKSDMNKPENRPECVGIIMDGNRRWAKRRGKPAIFGHKKGYDKLKEFVVWARNEGTKHLIVYAFSTENWNRGKTEVSQLMKLLSLVVKTEQKSLKKEGVRIRFIGELAKFSPEIQKNISKMEEATKNEKNINLYMAISYGGRAEILSAVRKVLSGKKDLLELSEGDLSRAMWTTGMPDPDLIIRTGGEYRLSNFLPWQSVYSELYFTKTLWPDLTKKEFAEIIKNYAKRERRNGR